LQEGRSFVRTTQKEIEDVRSHIEAVEDPDETRVFENGKLELVRIGGMTIGRYEPGWRWLTT
jgi:hypothetical protein